MYWEYRWLKVSSTIKDKKILIKLMRTLKWKREKKAIIHLYLKTFTVILNLQTFHTLEFWNWLAKLKKNAE